MSDHPYRFAAHGVRRITVDVARGDVRFSRIDGDQIVVEADDDLQVEQHEDEVRIGGTLTGRAKRRPDIHRDLDLTNLGSQINEVVGRTLDTFLGGGALFSGDVRIGIPALVERPAIAANLRGGDLELRGLTADWIVQTGSGDALIDACGGMLRLQSARGDISVTGFEGEIACTSGAGDLTVQRVSGRSHVRTGMGDVRLSECRSGGRVETGAGDVQARACAGEWTLRSGSGDVRMQVEGGGALSAQSGAGDVEVEGGALTRLQIQTGSGDVSCRSILVGTSHQIHTGNGDIRLALANPPGARLEVLTSNGDISSEFSLVRVGRQGPPSRGSQRYVGNVGNSSISVELRTNSGDISITRLWPDARAQAAGGEAATGEPSSAATGESFQYQSQSTRDISSPVPPIPPIPPIPPLAPMAPRRPDLADDEDRAERIREAAEEADVHAAEAEEARAAGDEHMAAALVAAGASGSGEDADQRMRILQSLQRGEINVAEAGILLDALGRTGD